MFRFTQAGSEVSALLGRIPSAVGYQPTLATDMGSMQERITTTTKGSITSVQVSHRIFCTGLIKERFIYCPFIMFYTDFWNTLKINLLEAVC